MSERVMIIIASPQAITSATARAWDLSATRSRSSLRSSRLIWRKRSETRNQKSETRGQRSETRGQVPGIARLLGVLVGLTSDFWLLTSVLDSPRQVAHGAAAGVGALVHEAAIREREHAVGHVG